MSALFTDAQLAAFLAGTLENDALIEAIEEAINADPALAERAEALALSAGDPAATAVRDAFAPVLDAPVPERLSRIVTATAAAPIVDLEAVRTPRPHPRPLPQPANDTGAGWRWPQFGAIAASLAIGALIGGPLLSGGANTRGEALVLAGADGTRPAPALAALLDTAPSGQVVDLAGLGTGEVVMTFRNTDGQLCRQFMIDAGPGNSDALACTGADGGWQVEALGRRAAPVGEMKLASGDAAVGVIAAVDDMIDSDPLVGDAELAELAELRDK